ncbi:hypothetical protein PMAYCL1PPCAC_29082 [Pristionchus mayeri]|uniref:Sugar phosphate phosphatase n=1 Tax=Pristionchus mayeri TaxID=1317129 RepID=A0AAN5IAJ6_9BILA|nr:hypothetical protein PMAYCL1PPCAC_29082 [Pristionchus mayeri]
MSEHPVHKSGLVLFTPAAGTDDETAPVLVGNMEGSFVHKTVRDRWPQIIGKIIDHFHTKRRHLMEQYGEEADADVKLVIGGLSEMRYRMTTDKVLTELTDDYHDVHQWNEKLHKIQNEIGADQTTWFRTAWMFTECYMYRSIYGLVHSTKLLATYDWFMDSKMEAFNSHVEQVKEAIYYVWACTNDVELTPDHVKETLLVMLRMSLWANRGDLSLSAGNAVNAPTNPVFVATGLQKKILADDMEEAVDDYLTKLEQFRRGGTRRVDIVLDNAGLELLMDLLLVEFLFKARLVDKVVLHGKAIPWFVSDATEADMRWQIDRLMNIDDITARTLSHKWKLRLQTGELSFHAHPFWTSWYNMEDMESAAPDLYDELDGNCSFLILKGDLNYRKLLRDRMWVMDTELSVAVGEVSLHPPILALRTNKSETIAGLDEDADGGDRDRLGLSSSRLVPRLLHPRDSTSQNGSCVHFARTESSQLQFSELKEIDDVIFSTKISKCDKRK